MKTPNRATRLLLLTLLVLAVAFVWLLRTAVQAEDTGAEISLDRVNRFAANGQIISATLLDEDAQVVGKVCESRTPAETGTAITPPVPADPASRCSGRIVDFRASYPRSDVSTQQLIQNIGANAPVVVDKQTDKAVAKLVVTYLLPLLMLANLFGLILVSKGGDSSIAEVAGFGRMARKRQRKERSSTGVTFADVAGAEEAVAELREVIDYLTDPARFEAFGAAPPKGVLLFGPPGCGKTLLARATAGESEVPFFSVSGTEFVESLVGVGAARVRDLFRQVREVAPAIVFIDEIDAVGRRRSGEGSTGGEREQTLNQLLVEVDGFEVTAGVVLMGATNRPDILDPALMRPGRFDRHVTLETPDVHGRKAILELHGRSRPMAPDVDYESLARRTPGFTGADLANVINEAALLTIRAGHANGTQIGNTHLGEAILRVLHGPQRRGMILTAEERKRLAFHESGHAIVAAAVGHHADVQRVSILARGKGLANAVVTRDAERVLLTRGEIEAELVIAMGGIAAEELYFAESSTTAQDDLDRASRLAVEMVGLYGMSTRSGRRRLLSVDGGYFYGDPVRMEPVSGATLQAFDEEVRRLLDSAEQRASELLAQHRDALGRMAEALEDQETLEGEALAALLAPARPEVSLWPGPTSGAGPLSPKPGVARSRRAKTGPET